MYLVNNAQLTRLPFFSRLFRPPGIFSPRIFRLPLFPARPSIVLVVPRPEGNPKNSTEQDQRELKSHSFDLTRIREAGKNERERERAFVRACARVRVTCIHVHYKPWSSSRVRGVSAPRFLADRARMRCNGRSRAGGWKRR